MNGLLIRDIRSSSDVAMTLAAVRKLAIQINANLWDLRRKIVIKRLVSAKAERLKF